MSLLNRLSVRADRYVNDLWLLSLCRLFLFVVLRHGIVDGIASHRACGGPHDRRPEAATTGGRGLIHSLVDNGRIFLHDGRALRCIGSGRSRAGERSTAAKASTTSCFRSCRNEKGDRNGRHNSFLHR